MHNETLKETEKTKSSTPITKNNSKNASAAHSNCKVAAGELNDTAHSSSAAKEQTSTHHGVSRSWYHHDVAHRRHVSGNASPDEIISSPNGYKSNKSPYGGRLLGKRENFDRE